MKRHLDPRPDEPLGATCGDPACTLPHLVGATMRNYLPALPVDQVCPICGDTGHPVAHCPERLRPENPKWWQR